MVDEQFAKFKRAFHEFVGHPLTSNTLSKRIIAQKIAYLLNKKNLTTVTYTHYNWYLHGVFNYDLWHSALYNLEEEIPISESELKEINTFKLECENAGLTAYFEDSVKMELITTILHVAKQQTDLDEENRLLVETVLNYKNKFTEKEVKEAITRLKRIEWNFR